MKEGRTVQGERERKPTKNEKRHGSEEKIKTQIPVISYLTKNKNKFLLGNRNIKRK